jgi:hypothetical protein
MDYHSMSLVELKEIAKNHKPKIKQYYIKPRIELIRILTMKEFTHEMVLAKRTLAELRQEAIDKGYKNIWKLRRAELVELLYPSPNKNNKNDDHAEEHDNPKHRERE